MPSAMLPLITEGVSLPAEQRSIKPSVLSVDQRHACDAPDHKNHDPNLSKKRPYKLPPPPRSSLRPRGPPGDDPEFPLDLLVEQGTTLRTRRRRLTSGFKFPPECKKAGVTEKEWEDFMAALKALATLDPTQRSNVNERSLVYKLFLGVLPGFIFGVVWMIPGIVYGFEYKKNQRDVHQLENIKTRKTMTDNGEVVVERNLDDVITHYNEKVFKPRGQIVRVVLPADPRMLKKTEIRAKSHAKKTGSRRVTRAMLLIMPYNPEGTLNTSSQAPPLLLSSPYYKNGRNNTTPTPSIRVQGPE